LKRSLETAWLSLVLLTTFCRVWWWLQRGGLESTVDRAPITLMARRATQEVNAAEATKKLRRAVREDELISWWLVKFHIHAICLYRALVMLRRLSQFPFVNRIELVLGVMRHPQAGVVGHAWLVMNECEFRQNPAVWTEFRTLYRLLREAPT